MSSLAKPSSPRVPRMIAGLALVVALAGCDGLPGLTAPDAEAGAAAEPGTSPGVVRIEERDVERPDIYATEDRALWDGRFSLGGRWVAVPEDINAARVKITNLANGQQIEGALFRREVTLPGPPIMVSMDAAVALGMEAGAPVNMRVVVVRSEAIEVQAPPTASVVADAGADTADAAGDAAGTAVAAAGAAAAAGGQTADVAVAAADPAPDVLTSSVLEALGSIAPPPPPPPAPVEEAEASETVAPEATKSAAAGSFLIQAAGGTNKAGAEAVARRLTDAGVSAEVREGTSQGNPYFRVFAGPYPDRPAFEAGLAQIRELGYSDAFAVN